MPGKVGEFSLECALRHKKDLIDLSDLEIEFFLKKRREIEKKKILVLPNCGFCPGLLNFLISFFVKKLKKMKKIEVLAGTLSPKKFFYPFLWCFEDLILEHELPSIQLINGKKKRFLPFSGLEREKFFGILAESYFAQSGFEQLMKKIKTKNFIFRVVRPDGFFQFYNFLKNHGFFEKENFKKTKKILESKIEDNLTFGQIKIKTKKENIFLIIKSFSKKEEKLNSMQKISIVFPFEILKKMKEEKLKKGLIFPEDLAKEKFSGEIFENLKNHSLINLKISS